MRRWPICRRAIGGTCCVSRPRPQALGNTNRIKLRLDQLHLADHLPLEYDISCLNQGPWRTADTLVERDHKARRQRGAGNRPRIRLCLVGWWLDLRVRQIEDSSDSARLRFEVDSPASDEQLALLVRQTERYCVIYQTLQAPPKVAVSVERVSA